MPAPPPHGRQPAPTAPAEGAALLSRPPARVRPLLAWLDEPSPEHGFRFAGTGAEDTWADVRYPALAASARQLAAGLVASGVAAGDPVALVLRSGPDFVSGLFGSLLAGCPVTPVAPPMTFQDPGEHDAHVARLLRSAGSRLVVAEEDLLARLAPLVAALDPAPALLSAAELRSRGTGSDGDRRPVDPDATAFIQFTSGSSGTARGVRVSHGALATNVAAIRDWLQMTPDDATASWLPAHHDMGLIGCLVTPVVNGSDVWLLQPEQFVHRPERYLACFGRRGARLTAMPNFGLSYIARRVRPGALDGMDFRHWRAVIVGAERLDQQVFESFVATLVPHGLDPAAVLPAYGLAEATLAVTGLPLRTGWTRLPVDPATLALGARVSPDPAAGHSLVGCGPALGGATVRILPATEDAGAGAQPLPDGTVGEIVVAGPNLADGYVAESPGSPSTFARGALRTGDAGVLWQGQLYVLGRLGDSLKIRGRSVFAEDIEADLTGAGIPPQRAVALLGQAGGHPVAVAVLEALDPARHAAAHACLARRAGEARRVVVDAPRGAISRTTSGKPRRRRMWHDFAAGRLPGTALGPDDPAPAEAPASPGGSTPGPPP